MRKIREWEARQDAKQEKLLFMDGGGQQQQAAAPTQQTITQTNLPEYARPYVENLMGRAQALTTSDPYQQYQGQRIAGFTPLQQQAFGNIAGMQPSQAVGAGIAAATDVAQQAGQAGQYTPGTFDAGRFTDPGVAASYMSPYMQNVVDVQQREAQRQAGIAGTQRQAQATGAGAFGGSRQAIVEAEANRNLATQLGNIQATGLQNAYQTAQQGYMTDAQRQLQAQQLGEQSRQYGAGLGLQGLQQQLAAAGQLGQLGQTQYGQQMGITAAQQQAGAQQQALAQQGLTQQYQDFLNQVRYPYQQLGFMSDIVRGMPLTGTSSQSLYQAPPSQFSQNIGLLGGLGSLGASLYRGA